eukprot:gene16568-22798_t
MSWRELRVLTKEPADLVRNPPERYACADATLAIGESQEAIQILSKGLDPNILEKEFTGLDMEGSLTSLEKDKKVLLDESKGIDSLKWAPKGARSPTPSGPLRGPTCEYRPRPEQGTQWLRSKASGGGHFDQPVSRYGPSEEVE